MADPISITVVVVAAIVVILILVSGLWRPILVIGIIAGLFAIGPIGWAILFFWTIS